MKTIQPPQPFDLYTGGKSKTAEIAIAYNLAFTNLEKLIHKLEATKKGFHELRDHTYIHLRNFLWKGHTENKNSSGYILTPDDRALVIALCEKLETIRNYHSHIWHDNAVLAFDEVLHRFVKNRFDVACASLRETNNKDVELFMEQLVKFPLFKLFENCQRITPEGRVFFLSFFLTHGEMSNLLQQLKGSKRQNSPEFRIKHTIFKYYCQRDGSAQLQFHHDETVFGQLTDEAQKQVLLTRQAYKIISYLNDRPAYLADLELLPLHIKTANGETRLAESITDLQLYLQQHSLFNNWKLYELKLKEADKGEKEMLLRIRAMEVEVTDLPGYRFRMSWQLLQKLIIACITGEEQEAERIQNRMHKFCADRKKLCEAIQAQIEGRELTDFNVLQWNQLLRGSSGLRAKFGLWLDHQKREPGESSISAVQLLNALRPATQKPYALPGKTKSGFNTAAAPRPIEPYWLDFYTEADQKPRNENRFVEFAARYLFDLGVLPDVYWQFEKFEVHKRKDKEVLEKQKAYIRRNIPEGYRISCTNDHVLLAIPIAAMDTDIYLKPKDNEKGTDQSDKLFHKILLGPQAMRLLLSCHVLKTDRNPTSDTTRRLFENLLHDLNLLKAAATIDTERAQFEMNKLRLLEPHHIPVLYHEALRKNKHSDGATKIKMQGWADQVVKRIDYLLASWNDIQSKPHLLRRHEKNRIILQTYTLYEWSPKFLRQNEYNNMSICHYLLHDKSKFNALFEKTFDLHKRVPTKIQALLCKAKSLDDLFAYTLQDAQQLLEAIRQNMTDGVYRKEDLLLWMRKMGLKAPDELIPLKEQTGVQQTKLKSVTSLPFDIAPTLLLKHFFKREYTNKEFIKSSPKHPLMQMRQEQYTKGLRHSNYPKTALQLHFPETAHKIIHVVDTALAEDALLWAVARYYLQNSAIGTDMAKTIKAVMAVDNPDFEVGKLHTTEVVFSIDRNLSEAKKVNAPDHTFPQHVFVKLRMHQLDDYMFRINQSRLYCAALHYRNRMAEEIEHGLPPFTPAKKDTENQTTVHCLPENDSSSPEKAITFDCLRLELQAIARQAQKAGTYLLDWERLVLNNELGTKTPEEKQAHLLILFPDRYAPFASNNTSVNTILRLATTYFPGNDALLEDIRWIRNAIMHSHIPVEGSYTKLLFPGTPIANLLNVTERIDAKKDRSGYEKQDEIKTSV